MFRPSHVVPASTRSPDSGEVEKLVYLTHKHVLYKKITSLATFSGQYSYQKLRALEEYRISYFKLLSIILFSPCPSSLVVVIAHCLPLADPSLGWRSAQNYYINSLISAFIAWMCNSIELSSVIPEFAISPWERTAIALVLTIILVLQKFLVAVILDIFPVPFGLVWPVFLCQYVGWALHCLCICCRADRSISFLYQKLLYYNLLYTAEELVLVVYPALATLFIYLGNNQKIWFSLVLPIPKFILNKLVSYYCRRLAPDLSAVVTATLVQFFHTLFFVLCLQSRKSDLALYISVFYKFFNVANFSFATYQLSLKMHRQLLNLVQYEKKYERMSSKLFSLSSALLQAENFVVAASFVLKHDAALQREFLSKDAIKESAFQRLLPAQVAIDENASSAKKRIWISQRRRRMVQQVTNTLHQLEHTLMCAYIDCFVPLLYICIYILVQYLPNAEYYSFVQKSERSQTISLFRNVIISFVAGTVSFFVHLIVVQRFLKFSALHQIAFVLDTYKVVVQSQWIRLIICLLFLSLRQSGNDFTFKFVWLQEKKVENGV